MPKSIEDLQAIARRVRRDIVEMIYEAKSGHPGGSLSAVEILVESLLRLHEDRSPEPPLGGSRPTHLSNPTRNLTTVMLGFTF